MPSKENKKKEKEKKRKGENSRSKESEESKKGKFPIKENGGKQKRKRILDQRSEEKRRNMQKGLRTRQYLNNTDLSPSKQEKKGNHDLKWSSPFDCQPKSCVSVTCLPHTKQKQKRKRPKNTQSQISHQEIFNPLLNDRLKMQKKKQQSI